jgi:hypothetical protein
MQAEDYLKEPRLPRRSPVLVLHVRADNDRNGNPRRCFVVLTPAGRLVSVIDEGYGGESVVHAAFPWFAHTVARRLGLETCYAVPIYATPAEYRRWLRAGGELLTEVHADASQLAPDVVHARKLAERARRWSAVRDALVRVRQARAGHEHRELIAEREGRENHYGDTSTTPIYWHGDDHLRRAMRALERAGMVERVGDVSNGHGIYRATATTPDLY